MALFKVIYDFHMISTVKLGTISLAQTLQDLIKPKGKSRKLKENFAHMQDPACFRNIYKMHRFDGCLLQNPL